MNVFTIPSDHNFLEDLAKNILKESKNGQFPLSEYQILLPNRRSCQNLRDLFLDLSDGQILLLPRIHPIGDVDEQELYFSPTPEIASEIANLPPSISVIQRQFLLTKLIEALEDQTATQTRTFRQRLVLAKTLGEFLDQIIIEELSFESLQQIVPEEFAHHWQITLEFLEILSVAWPKILKERGVVESTEHRKQLIDIQARYWSQNPPPTPIIIAGSTGTMPASVRLMKVVASLPNGQVILPGLDLLLDGKSWDSLSPSHPQSLIKQLLYEMDIERADVKQFQDSENMNTARRTLVREIMRPAETIDQWRLLNENSLQDMQQDLKDVDLYECDTLRQEAFVVALKLREVLETPGRTAALVTPDRKLAQQTKLICQRWGINLDDTAGVRLSDTSLGQFIIQVLKVYQSEFKPSDVLSLLKHPLCCMGKNRQEIEKQVLNIDIELRGPVPQNIFDKLKDYPVASMLREIYDQYAYSYKEENKPLESHIRLHLDLLEELASTDGVEGAEYLWSRDEGEAAAALFHRILAEGQDLGEISALDYIDVIESLMKNVLLRPKYGTHPRLLIMGQIEARLIKADVMILSGLNEGTWPILPEASPWMSRPMQTEFGLPDSERAIALAAHDFSQAFSAKEVILTRTLRQNGTATVPARWLQRLDIILKAGNFTPDTIRTGSLKDWANKIDQSDDIPVPANRPQPRPHLSRRPASLPVTAIETWMRDPYSIYAKYILNLRPLDSVEQASDAAQRGNWLHEMFEWFVRTYPESMPSNAQKLMVEYALNSDKAPAENTLFLPKLERLVEWFVQYETEWRQIAKTLPQALEIRGDMDLDGFNLHATADRIDVVEQDNRPVIIDYKTGRIPSNADIVNGLSPQITLEGAILKSGGFNNVPLDISALKFIKVSGGRTPGEEVFVEGRNVPDLETLINDALEGLKALLAEFQNEETPYLSLPDVSKAPPEEWQSYAQLARVQEWATIEEGDA